MLQKIVSVRAIEGYRLHLRFQDGIEGTVALAAIAPFQGVFVALQDRQRGAGWVPFNE